jgi:hypothetical protein
VTDFDTEKPPVARWGPPATPGSASRIPELTIGPDIVLDFTGNPAAAEPFFEWLRTGAAWAAFGGWFDGVG